MERKVLVVDVASILILTVPSPAVCRLVGLGLWSLNVIELVLDLTRP